MFLLPPNPLPVWDASLFQGTFSIKLDVTHLYIWVESVLPKNTTQSPQPGFMSGPVDLEMSALTMTPPHLPE